MNNLLTKPFDLILFGGTGDLSLRKLLPSLFRAFNENLLPDDSRIIVCSRNKNDYENMYHVVENALTDFMLDDEFNPSQFKSFRELMVPCNIDVINKEKGWHEFTLLFERREQISRIFYLAIIPNIYGQCCENLAHFSLVTDKSRVVVEKPIGYDKSSAEKINEEIASYFDEQQIYRIDHYLGKETVQNLLTLRFANSLFEQFWDAKSIDHVQISINEKVGLEGRAEFYDGTGALRDMVQNHLLQLVALVAMESPNNMSADNIRGEKIKVLRALRKIENGDVKKQVVTGQYVAGNIDDKLVSGYLEELKAPSTNTETFVAIKAHIDNFRWSKVPFYLKTGKRLHQRSAEIVIQFKDISHNVFDKNAGSLLPNRLIIQLQPEERMQLFLMAKDLTQFETKLKPVKLDLNFTETEKSFKSFGYKRLLLDAIAGNPTLFIHRDEGAAAWDWIDPIIDQLTKKQIEPFLYRAGTSGPEESTKLLTDDQREWVHS